MSDSANSMDGRLPGSSVHGILQARILEWVAVPSSGDLPNPGIEPTFLTIPASIGRFFNTGATWEAVGSEPVLYSKLALWVEGLCTYIWLLN